MSVRTTAACSRKISTRWLHRWPGFDADDGEQIGMIGLIEAARRFDPKKGCQFSTYANYWVRQACKRVGLSAALSIRLPYKTMQSLVAYRRYLERLTVEHGPARANEELSRRCMADEAFRQRWQGFQRAVSIRSLSNRAESEYQQARRLEAPSLIPLEQQRRDDKTAIVRAAIDGMRPRDQRFIRLRHGIGCEPNTLAAIGKGENITREAVRQVLKKAEGRLRRPAYRVPTSEPMPSPAR
jgi:RNA polymerase primary sigma factor